MLTEGIRPSAPSGRTRPRNRQVQCPGQMASYLDSVPFSGIIRIRDMMYTVDRPFRLDQGDVSFDAPESVKAALHPGRARQSHALRADDGHSAAARSARQEDAREKRHPDRRRRRSDGDVGRHPRRVRRSARACSSRATKCSCPIPNGRRRRATCRARTPCRSAIRCTNRSAGGRTWPKCARLVTAEDARDLRELAQQSRAAAC